MFIIIEISKTGKKTIIIILFIVDHKRKYLCKIVFVIVLVFDHVWCVKLSSFFFFRRQINFSKQFLIMSRYEYCKLIKTTTTFSEVCFFFLYLGMV